MVLSVIFLIGQCGFFYLILTLQVCNGFPPFYEKGDTLEEMKLDIPFLIAIVVFLAASAIFPYLFIIFGFLSVWVGIRIRQRVRNRTNGPLLWVLTPLTIGILNRWPMLLFDAWTVGFAALALMYLLKIKFG